MFLFCEQVFAGGGFDDSSADAAYDGTQEAAAVVWRQESLTMVEENTR